MAVCKPIYPSGVLKDDKRITIPSMEDIVSSLNSPIERYDNELLQPVSVLLNGLLKNDTLPLSSRPSLKRRLNSSNPITDEEFADFIFESGKTVEEVRDTIIAALIARPDQALIMLD